MRILLTGLSHHGRRSNNEDSILIKRLGGGGYLLAVADGMGGHQAGERASGIAVTILEQLSEQWDRKREAPHEFLSRAIEAVNSRIYELAHSDEALAGMGTTIAIALIVKKRLFVAHVGDSRACLVGEDGLEQITEDHSMLRQSVRDGLMTEEEASASPFANALSRAVGTDAKVDIDIFPDDGKGFPLEENSIVFLTSDGLHGYVPQADILESFRTIADLKTACSHLQSLAYWNGGDDNISIVALELGRFRRTKKLKPLPPLPVLLKREAAKGKKRPVLTAMAVLLSAVFLGLLAVTTWLIFSEREGMPAKTVAAKSAVGNKLTPTLSEEETIQSPPADLETGDTAEPQEGESSSFRIPHPTISSALEVSVIDNARVVTWWFPDRKIGDEAGSREYTLIFVGRIEDRDTPLFVKTLNTRSITIERINQWLAQQDVPPLDHCFLIVATDFNGEQVKSEPVRIPLR
jgi:serine/threonine protein phosphatase PrpC